MTMAPEHKATTITVSQIGELSDPMAPSSFEISPSASSDPKRGETCPASMDTELTAGASDSSLALVRDLLDSADVCSQFTVDLEAAQNNRSGEGSEIDPSVLREHYKGSARHGKEDLQRAIESLMAVAPEAQHGQSSAGATALTLEDRCLQMLNEPGDTTEAIIAGSHSKMNGLTISGESKQATADDWPKEEYITAEEWSDMDFRQIEAWFMGLENPSVADEVVFARAKRKEELRRKILQSRIANRNELTQEDDGLDLFVNEGEFPKSSGSIHLEAQAEESAPTPGQGQTGKSRGSFKPSEKDMTKSMELGLRKIIGFNRFTKDLYGSEDREAGNRRRGKSRAKTLDLSNEELERIFQPGDIASSARANAQLHGIPRMTSTNKTQALAELVASVPAKDQAVAKSDRTLIMDASRQFDYKPSSDGKGGWKVKGLMTGLHHHQVLAVGWMRERERALTPPRGGLLCDVMGLGKTLTVLTNILDGRPGKDDERRQTLIIVPSNLLKQWADQIGQFLDLDMFGAVYEYKHHTRMNTQNSINCMLRHDVVLASYEDVRRSYPTMKPPDELRNKKKEIEDWWVEFFPEQIGPLHLVKWHRIVLDECHNVRNPETAISVAVRALIGKHKWAMSGTPLHNCIEELYSYFNFIGVPKSATLGDFEEAFCDETAKSRKCLINMLRSVLHRKTHDSRLFGLPIVKLPNLTVQEEVVALCKTEKILYDEIVQSFVMNINRLSQCGKQGRQWHCILTMFLALRMFCSHPLTAQVWVQHVLKDEEILSTLKELHGDENEIMHDPSARIARMLLLATNDPSVSAALPALSESDIPKMQLMGDRDKLVKEYREFIERLYAEECWQEACERAQCVDCENVPFQSIVTSCKHLYCEECFHQPRNEDKNSETGHRTMCRKCPDPIAEAAYSGALDGVNMEARESSVSTETSTQLKRKRSKGKGANRKAHDSKKDRRGSTGAQSSAMFRTIQSRFADTDDENDTDQDSTEENWIPTIGESTPGAKLTRVREILKKWLGEDESAKVIIFTQFLNTVSLLRFMCANENWGTTTLTGKLSLTSRERNITRFREDKDIKVLIASLKTGGEGLNLAIANKCILMDLWWTTAAEEQAYCRSYRIGQTRDVEYVRIIAENTIDDKIVKIQKAKTEMIKNYLSPRVLEDRDTVEDILKAFGKVITTKEGGFYIELGTATETED